MLRRFLITFSIVVSIIIVFSVIVTQKRDERKTLEAKKNELAKTVDFLKEKNVRLKKENDALVNDPIQIEREARENYGYIKPGEVTYKKYKFNISEPENDKVKQPNKSNKIESFLFDGPFPWQVPLGLILIAAIFLLVSYRYER
ncbi:MAG: putative septum formation initiator [Candidatus Scalindua rubra]|uniref:Putative septum formation initiator n=1 Tax=Candidatus Scalindua rubra TaxID=1872076 RepID=A0A1E3XBZ0_9BACT|nr:MAG: putative septum formation initiator [Candidatus Scalindua rubra]